MAREPKGQGRTLGKNQPKAVKKSPATPIYGAKSPNVAATSSKRHRGRQSEINSESSSESESDLDHQEPGKEPLTEAQFRRKQAKRQRSYKRRSEKRQAERHRYLAAVQMGMMEPKPCDAARFSLQQNPFGPAPATTTTPTVGTEEADKEGENEAEEEDEGDDSDDVNNDPNAAIDILSYTKEDRQLLSLFQTAGVFRVLPTRQQIGDRKEHLARSSTAEERDAWTSALESIKEAIVRQQAESQLTSQTPPTSNKGLWKLQTWDSLQLK